MDVRTRISHSNSEPSVLVSKQHDVTLLPATCYGKLDRFVDYGETEGWPAELML